MIQSEKMIYRREIKGHKLKNFGVYVSGVELPTSHFGLLTRWGGSRPQSADLHACLYTIIQAPRPLGHGNTDKNKENILHLKCIYLWIQSKF